jgi:uncharacterized protein Yka (UPF0111/DUF47 family)
MSILLLLLKILENKLDTHMHVNNNDVDNHIQFINHAFDNPFPNMENKYSTIKEIEQIINSLKTKTHLAMMEYLQKF